MKALSIRYEDLPETSAVRRMRAAAKDIWEECMTHPFVQGIGDGSLAIEKFRHYMLQDYLYLFDYARVFALGAVKAPPALMQDFSANVEAILGGEMEIHRAYMRRLGIREEDVLAVRPALDNLAYTHYMLAIAQAGGLPEIMTAILACSWTYAEIGERLAQIPEAKDHLFYGEWIKGYSGDGFISTNAAILKLTDALCGDIQGERMDRLTEIFIHCCRFERGFWDMAWHLRT